PPPPSPTLFPYTTLFRSDLRRRDVHQGDVLGRRHHRLALRRTAEDGVGRELAVLVELCARLGDHVARLLDRVEVDDLVAHLAARSEEHTSELQSRSDLVC